MKVNIILIFKLIIYNLILNQQINKIYSCSSNINKIKIFINLKEDEIQYLKKNNQNINLIFFFNFLLTYNQSDIYIDDSNNYINTVLNNFNFSNIELDIKSFLLLNQNYIEINLYISNFAIVNYENGKFMNYITFYPLDFKYNFDLIVEVSLIKKLDIKLKKNISLSNSEIIFTHLFPCNTLIKNTIIILKFLINNTTMLSIYKKSVNKKLNIICYLIINNKYFVINCGYKNYCEIYIYIDKNYIINTNIVIFINNIIVPFANHTKINIKYYNNNIKSGNIYLKSKNLKLKNIINTMFYINNIIKLNISNIKFDIVFEKSIENYFEINIVYENKKIELELNYLYLYLNSLCFSKLVNKNKTIIKIISLTIVPLNMIKNVIIKISKWYIYKNININVCYSDKENTKLFLCQKIILYYNKILKEKIISNNLKKLKYNLTNFSNDNAKYIVFEFWNILKCKQNIGIYINNIKWTYVKIFKKNYNCFFIIRLKNKIKLINIYISNYYLKINLNLSSLCILRIFSHSGYILMKEMAYIINNVLFDSTHIIDFNNEYYINKFSYQKKNYYLSNNNIFLNMSKLSLINNQIAYKNNLKYSDYILVFTIKNKIIIYKIDKTLSFTINDKYLNVYKYFLLSNKVKHISLKKRDTFKILILYKYNYTLYIQETFFIIIIIILILYFKCCFNLIIFLIILNKIIMINNLIYNRYVILIFFNIFITIIVFYKSKVNIFLRKTLFNKYKYNLLKLLFKSHFNLKTEIFILIFILLFDIFEIYYNHNLFWIYFFKIINWILLLIFTFKKYQTLFKFNLRKKKPIFSLELKNSLIKYKLLFN